MLLTSKTISSPSLNLTNARSGSSWFRMRSSSWAMSCSAGGCSMLKTPVSLCSPRPISIRPAWICQSSSFRPGTWQWSSAAATEPVLWETDRPSATSSWKSMSASEPAPRILHTAGVGQLGALRCGVGRAQDD